MIKLPHKHKETKSKEDSKNGKIDLFKGVFLITKLLIKFISDSLGRDDLQWLIKNLKKAEKSFNDSGYFTRLIRRYNLLKFVASIPSLAAMAGLGYYLLSDNSFTREMKRLLIGLIKLAKGKKIDPEMLIPNVDAFIYFSVFFVILLILVTVSHLLFSFIVKNSPLIVNSKLFRDYCIANNYSGEDDKIFLVCNAGVMAQLSNVPAERLTEDKILWRQLERTPRDPIQHESDPSVVWVGNGFKLAKEYIFNIK